MAIRTAPKRMKVSMTIDAYLLEGVDDFVRTHQGIDRSKVMDEVLMLWHARRQQRDMEAQFADPGYPPEEMDAWRAIRRQAAIRTLARTAP